MRDAGVDPPFWTVFAVTEECRGGQSGHRSSAHRVIALAQTSQPNDPKQQILLTQTLAANSLSRSADRSVVYPVPQDTKANLE